MIIRTTSEEEPMFLCQRSDRRWRHVGTPLGISIGVEDLDSVNPLFMNPRQEAFPVAYFHQTGMGNRSDSSSCAHCMDYLAEIRFCN